MAAIIFNLSERRIITSYLSAVHIYRALELEWDDFEDSVQFTAGESLSADYITARALAVRQTPEEVIHALVARELASAEV